MKQEGLETRIGKMTRGEGKKKEGKKKRRRKGRGGRREERRYAPGSAAPSRAGSG